MKDKRLLYFLLPAVTLVWGLIIWRIWAATSEPQEMAALPASPVLANPRQASTRPPRLLLSYGDPFTSIKMGRSSQDNPPAPVAIHASSSLQLVPAPSTSHLALPVRAAVPPVVVAAAVTWPQVKYLGTITHTNGQTQVALLSIDNEEAVVKVGQRVRSIQVLHLFKDSVQLMHDSQKKMYYRSSEQ